MDPLADFLSAYCTEESSAKVSSSDLYKAYQSWAAENGENTLAKNAFGSRLTERGFESGRMTFDGKQVRGWKGLKLKEEVELDIQTYLDIPGVEIGS